VNAQRLANGRLLIPARAESSDGTLGDSMVEIGPDHPDYAKWLAEAPKFIDIAMPERFVLEVPTDEGGWIDHGLFRAADLVLRELATRWRPPLNSDVPTPWTAA
jgi:hypothetical protein